MKQFLLRRLDAGDELHREAAAAIRELKAELADADREARQEARDAYAAGLAEAEIGNERGGPSW